jgi:hypothetical protein
MGQAWSKRGGGNGGEPACSPPGLVFSCQKERKWLKSFFLGVFGKFPLFHNFTKKAYLSILSFIESQRKDSCVR